MKPVDERLRATLSFWEGWLSIGLNTILFALKYWVGIISGSVAVMADAWHTLSDSLTSVVVLIGAKVSNKSADEEHPFGHGRAELIASVVIGVVLGIVGINFLVEAINKLRFGESASYGWSVVLVFVLSVIGKEAMAQFAIRSGKKTGSKALMADGWHHRSDAIASLIILCGVFVGHYFWWIDGVLGIAVSLLIFYATYEILKQSVDPLIGEKPDDELIETVHSIVGQIAAIEFDLHHFHIHCYGSFTELTFHLKFLQEISFVDAHRIATRVEKRLKEQLHIHATIHIEPHE